MYFKEIRSNISRNHIRYYKHVYNFKRGKIESIMQGFYHNLEKHDRLVFQKNDVEINKESCP